MRAALFTFAAVLLAAAAVQALPTLAETTDVLELFTGQTDLATTTTNDEESVGKCLIGVISVVPDGIKILLGFFTITLAIPVFGPLLIAPLVAVVGSALFAYELLSAAVGCVTGTPLPPIPLPPALLA